ncbi:Transposase [Halanaeroarchaeum sp. HSR-CO]|nr:Transposase [Halanaeroarchaeum sp. HSR-CO]
MSVFVGTGHLFSGTFKLLDFLVQRVFQEIIRRTNHFYNTFSRASVESAENWFKALAWVWNQLI